MWILKALYFISIYPLVFADSGITYHGRLIQSNSVPVTSSSVQFKMQIRTSGVEDCLLYEEIQTVDLSTTSGMFSISLADGSGIRQDSNSWNLFEALSNRKDFSFSSSDCTGGNLYSPNATDNRKFRVYFNDGTFPAGTWEALPVQTINFIPMSIESYAVGGFPASALLRVEDAGTLGTPSALTTTQYNEIVSLVSGSSSLYEKDGELNGSSLPTISANESVRWTGSAWQSFTPLTSETDPNVEAFAKSSLPTCATGEVLKSDGTSLSCVTDAGGWSAVDATTTVKGIVNVPTTGGLEVTSGAIGLPDVVTGGTYTKVTVDAKGRITTGANITGSDITSGTIGGSTSISTTGSISSASLSTRQIDLYDSDNSHHISLLTPATADLTSNYDLVFPSSLGTSNQILGMNNAGTALENKSITAGTGVTINHTAGGIEIEATGTGGTVTSVTGTSPISVATGTTTPVISLDDAGTAGTYGSSTEVPVFTTDAKGRVTSVTETTISGVSPVGSALATGQAWVGDGSGEAQARFIGFSDLKTSIAGNANQIPTTCTASQTMTYSAVTDVFSCSNISITASQVSDLSTELADYVEVAGDTMTGTLNLPSNGLIVGTDELVVSGGNVGIGTTSPSAPLNVVHGDNATTIRLQNTDASLSSSFGFRDASGANKAYIEWANSSYGGPFGTDSFTLFTLSEDPLIFGTYNAERLRISEYGNVGIGTTNPNEKLSVSSANGYTWGLIEMIDSDASGQNAGLSLNSYDTATSGSNSVLELTNYRNTKGATALAVTSNNYLGTILFQGSNGSGSVNEGAYISAQAASDFSSTSAASRLLFSTSASGSTTPSERMRIDEDGNIGIGTNNPSTKLEVAGTIKATAFEGPLNATTSSIGDGSAASPSMTFINDSNTGFYSSGADSIGISAGGSQVWNITTSSIVSPTVGGGSMSSSNGTASAPTFSFAGDLDTGWFRPAADTLAASTGGTERVRIDSSGNVGIGTTNPGTKLDIVGATADLVRINSTAAPVTGGSSGFAGKNFYFEDGTNFFRLSPAGLSRYADNTFGSGGPVLGFVSSAAGLYRTNVGVGGLANGNTKLKVSVNSSETGVSGLHVNSWVNNSNVAVFEADSVASLFTGDVTTMQVDRSASSSFNLIKTIIDADGTPSYPFIVRGDGNVGVGTMAPSQKFHVHDGNLTVRSDSLYSIIESRVATDTATHPTFLLRRMRGTLSASTYPLSGDRLGTISFRGNDATSGANIIADATEDHSSTAKGTNLQFQTIPNGDTTATSKMIIMSDGNVGIGTTAPQGQLEVQSSAAASFPANSGTTQTGLYMRLSRPGGGNLDIGGAGSAGMWLQGNNWTDLSINYPLILNPNGGNIGIGTTTVPTSSLQIKNSIFFDEGNGAVGLGPDIRMDAAGLIAADDSLWINIDADNSSTAGASFIVARDSMTTAGVTELFVIEEEGNVGIGTTSPSHILHINGQGRATNAAWATTSDIRLKDIQRDYEYGLEEILKLHTVWFNYKKDNPLSLPSDKAHAGIIAQELQKVIPEAVEETSDGYLTVNNDPVQWAAINAIKDLYGVCKMDREQMDRKFASLEEENIRLKNELTLIRLWMCEKDQGAPGCQE